MLSIVDGDRSVVSHHHVMYDGKTETRTAGLSGSRLIHAIESFKDMFLFTGGNSHSGVLYVDADAFCDVFGMQQNLPAVQIILDSVFHQIEQNLIQVVVCRKQNAVLGAIQQQPDILPAPMPGSA